VGPTQQLERAGLGQRPRWRAEVKAGYLAVYNFPVSISVPDVFFETETEIETRADLDEVISPKEVERTMKIASVLFVFGAAIAFAAPNAVAQKPPGQQSSPNMKLIAHLPLGDTLEVADIEIEQEMSRPYAYVSRMGNPYGFEVIDLRDLNNVKSLGGKFLDDGDLHRGLGALKGVYFKSKGRYYYVQGFQFRQDPDRDLGAIIYDVTGLPDMKTVKEVRRLRVPEVPGGFHNMFAYKHSNGKTYLCTTVEAPLSYLYGAHMYDVEKLVAGAADYGLEGRIPLPEPRGANRGYHDCYIGFDPATGQDKFYGGGPETTYLGGNFVFDVTDVTAPKLLVTLHAQESQQSGGHTFMPTNDGRYALTIMTSYAHAPVRFYDLKPALDGKVAIIKQPIGEWTADSKKSSHMIEIRWPYAFIAAYEDGVHVVNMRDPTNPRTVAFYDTYDEVRPFEGLGAANGVFGLDVRNADGLIVAGDMHSGFWAFKMEGFNGWNGKNWGVPNVSTAQDWDNGPDGADKWKKKPTT
jgi:hypothetical protein